jgi:hypothetical protein
MNDSQTVTYSLQRSSTGRWGYRPGQFIKGLTFVDSESGGPRNVPDASIYKFADDTDIADLPDGVALSIDYIDMSKDDFIEAFTADNGFAPPKAMLYDGETFVEA